MILKFADPECVMIRIHKTGSTSIINGIFKNQKPLRKLEFPQEWRRYYSFAFVRNPFDRLVSAYLMFQKQYHNTYGHELTIDKALDIIQDPNISTKTAGFASHVKRHLVPMTSDCVCIESAQQIFRFENYDTEYDRLAYVLQVKIKSTPHILKSKRRLHYRQYFNAHSKTRALTIFANDLEIFGYEY